MIEDEEDLEGNRVGVDGIEGESPRSSIAGDVEGMSPASSGDLDSGLGSLRAVPKSRSMLHVRSFTLLGHLSAILPSASVRVQAARSTVKHERRSRLPFPSRGLIMLVFALASGS